MPKELTIEEILAQDPEYLAALARWGPTGQGAINSDTRNKSLQQALIRYGFLPPEILAGLGIYSQAELDLILDPTTRSLIEKSTKSGLSTWARLKEAADTAFRGVPTQTASQGMFRSGQTSAGLRKVQMAADRARADSLTNNQGSGLLDYLTGVQQGFAKAERERLDELEKARLEALGEYVPPRPPTLPPLSPEETPFKDYYEGLIKKDFATPYTPGEPVTNPYGHPGRTEGRQSVPPAVVPGGLKLPPVKKAKKGTRGFFPEGPPARGGGRR